MKNLSTKNLGKKIISHSALLKKCQAVFNCWIRNRDKDKGCISCTTGGVHNAGHYYHGHLYGAIRFNEINVQGQCVPCNLSKAGNREGFRHGLIKRYGEQKVLELERSVAIRTVRKWSRFELEMIIKMYKL